MPSAWTLFYNRRYHAGRSPDVELGLDPLPPDRYPDPRRPRHHHGHGGRGRHGGEDRDPHPGDPHPRHLRHRAHRTERESVQLDRISSESSARNGGNGTAAGREVSTLGLIRNDQLPGTVLRARARLLERLRGSLAGTRQSPAAASGIAWDELADFTVSDPGDWEAETHWQWFESAVPYADLDGALPFHDAGEKKTPRLDWEALCSLQREVFRNAGDSDGITRESLECCICLERFREGDGLIRLHCAHRFHPACLEPWVQATANCPYCRKIIIC